MLQNKTKLLFITIFILLFTGCGKKVQVHSLYIWNDYVNNSMEYAMNGEKQKVREKYIATLKKIIDDSKAKKRKVAPGIYAEYGQILFKTNHKKEAKKYFLLEKQTYPESSKFIDLVIKKLYGDS
jgi:hypothetical protein